MSINENDLQSPELKRWRYCARNCYRTFCNLVGICCYFARKTLQSSF